MDWERADRLAAPGCNTDLCFPCPSSTPLQPLCNVNSCSDSCACPSTKPICTDAGKCMVSKPIHICLPRKKTQQKGIGRAVFVSVLGNSIKNIEAQRWDGPLADLLQSSTAATQPTPSRLAACCCCAVPMPEQQAVLVHLRVPCGHHEVHWHSPWRVQGEWKSCMPHCRVAALQVTLQVALQLQSPPGCTDTCCCAGVERKCPRAEQQGT